MPNEHMVLAVNAPVPHNPRLLRNAAWSQHGGQTGIVGPYSLEVRAQDIPGEAVQVLPGSFVIAANPGGTSGYRSLPRQAYTGDVEQTRTVNIRRNGSSSARTDVIGIIINDPEVEGTLERMTEDDLKNHRFWDFHVIENYPWNTSTPASYGLSRPFVPLARVKLPPNRADVRAEDITDLRFLASRFYDTAPFSYTPLAERNFTGPGTFTINVDQQIPIPQYATRLVLDARVDKARLIGSTPDVIGYARARILVGSGAVEGNEFLLERTRIFEVGNVANSRTDIAISGIWNIPPERRGQNMRLHFQFELEAQPGTLRIVESNTRFNAMLHWQETPQGVNS